MIRVTASVFPHTTYKITITRINETGETAILQDVFHSHLGFLTLNFHNVNTNDTANFEGSRNLSLEDAIMADDNGTVNLHKALPAQGGTYQVHTEILGVNNDTLQRDSLSGLTFDYYLSMGMAFSKNISFRGQYYNVTVTSYLNEVNDLDFDQEPKTFSWKMPFDWDSVSRPNGTALFVHEHITVPKSLEGFSDDASAFNATVNGIPIKGSMQVDPYSSEQQMVFHYLLNQNHLANISDKMQAQNQTSMDFGLSPGSVIPEFGSSSATMFAAIMAPFMMIAAYHWQRKKK